MVEHVQALLEQGYVVQCWKDAEFLYTYHAWINIPYADIAVRLVCYGYFALVHEQLHMWP